MPVEDIKQTHNTYMFTSAQREKQAPEQVQTVRKPLWKGSLSIAVASALLARIAGRISFVILKLLSR